MNNYSLGLYYQSNHGLSRIIRSLPEVMHEGPTRKMLTERFPQFSKTGWSTDLTNRRNNRPGFCMDLDDGLYIRVENMGNGHVRLWRPREWIGTTYRLSDAGKVAGALR